MKDDSRSAWLFVSTLKGDDQGKIHMQNAENRGGGSVRLHGKRPWHGF